KQMMVERYTEPDQLFHREPPRNTKIIKRATRIVERGLAGQACGRGELLSRNRDVGHRALPADQQERDVFRTDRFDEALIGGEIVDVMAVNLEDQVALLQAGGI